MCRYVVVQTYSSGPIVTRFYNQADTIVSHYQRGKRHLILSHACTQLSGHQFRHTNNSYTYVHIKSPINKAVYCADLICQIVMILLLWRIFMYSYANALLSASHAVIKKSITIIARLAFNFFFNKYWILIWINVALLHVFTLIMGQRQRVTPHYGYNVYINIYYAR